MGKDMFCFVFYLKQNLILMPVSYKSEFQGFLFIVYRKAFLASWPYFVFIKLQIFLQITSMQELRVFTNHLRIRTSQAIDFLSPKLSYQWNERSVRILVSELTQDYTS